MTALAGGAADKIGNRYEHWWTACRIADLLEGRIRSIRLEPLGLPGQGVEFVVEDADGTTGEQAKSTSARWTLNRLKSEKVLDAIAVQLRQGRSFRLVTAGAAEEFATLAHRARDAETLQEFEIALGTRCGDLDVVRRAWDVDRERCREMLRRVYVEQQLEDSLRRVVESRWERLYVGEATVVIGALWSFCVDHLHRSITAPQVRTYLERLGLRRALLVGDQDVLRRLADTVTAQRRAVEAVEPSRGRVPRSVSAEVFARLGEDDCRVLVLDGDAGTGKSAVAAEVAQLAEEDGWFVAVTRLDGIDPSVRTSPTLGRAMDLEGCPVTMLAGVSGEHPSLLVVDQLDAVSTHSGRMPDTFLAVTDVLERARSAPALRVLLVVRAVDLRADPRLSSLLRDGVARASVGLLSDEDVEAYLDAGEFTSLDAVTRELLRTPLHLAVHLRLVDRGATSYRTLTELYDAYTEQVRVRLDVRPGGCDTRGVVDTLVRAMSENETLSAPKYVLDGFPPADVGALESQGLVVVDHARKTVRFFHETYLDHVFARWFLREGQDLHSHLASSGQALFQRAPTRQVLTLLAATDRPRFRVTITGLLTSPDIRTHLKMLVLDVLIGLDAEPADWERLEPLSQGGDQIAGRVRALLVHPAWFDAADGLGRWQRWLADESTVDLVFPQMSRCARERPERIDALVRPFVGSGGGWSRRFRHLVSWSLCPQLVDLAAALYEQGVFDVEHGGPGVSVGVGPLPHVDPDDVAAAAPLLGSWLRRGMVLAHAAGCGDLFAAGVLGSDPSDDSTVRGIVRAAPGAFVTEVLPVVVQVTTAQPRPRAGLFPAGRFAARYRGTSHGMDQALFSGLEEALRRLAVEDRAACDTALAHLAAHESDELQFLACRTLTTRGGPDAAIEWLLDDERRFYLGWSDNTWWAARELVEAWSLACSPRTLKRLEAALLAHRSPVESRGQFGRTQLELLSGIATDRLSDDGRRRLDELSRRYPPIRPPQVITAHFVGSPIAEDASAAMSDEQWLGALRKHDTDELRFDDDLRRIGGARELALQLGRRAASEPERFARLALRFDATVPAAAFGVLVREVTGKVGTDLLLDVCERARKLHGAAVGLAVCWALGDSAAADARVVTLLAECAEDPDPAGPGASSGSDLLTAGLNCTRGAAAVAVARTLFGTGTDVDALVPVVERLATDEVPQVRVVAAEAVLALMNHREQRALDIALDLFGDPQAVLVARTTARLLQHCLARAPERFAAVLKRGLAGDGQCGHHAGQVWAATVLYARLPHGTVADVAALPVDARRGAAEVFASDPGASVEHLAVLADDGDDPVLSSVGQAAHHLDHLTDHQLEELIVVLLSAAARRTSLTPLLHMLESSPRLPGVALEVCEMAVALAAAEASDVRTGNAALARQALTVVLRLYRAGDEGVRSRCLDVVDRLSEVDAYGLDRALADER